MSAPLRSQAIAFAATCQAALLVHRIANGLATISNDVAPLTHGIFATDPSNIHDVYGGTANLRTGIATASELMRRPSADLAPVVKYLIALLDVETRLHKRADLTRQLRSGIDQLQASFRSNAPDLFEQVSMLYQNTISQLDRRIHVVGSAELLKEKEVAAKIRSLLLAGIRSVWLWRQSGGRRWHLLLRRSTMRSALAELTQPTMIH